MLAQLNEPSCVAVDGAGVVYISDSSNTRIRKVARSGVSRTTPVITWANPAPITYPAPLTGTQLNASASVPGTFVYTPSAGRVPNPGAGRTLSVTFTPTDTVNYTTATATVTIDVKPLLPTFTDATLMAGVTVKAVHLTELRQAIETLGTWYGLTAVVWTDASIVAGVTPVRAVHLTELRTSLSAVYVAAGRTVPTYVHVVLPGGATVITAVDVAELRAAILEIW